MGKDGVDTLSIEVEVADEGGGVESAAIKVGVDGVVLSNVVVVVLVEVKVEVTGASGRCSGEKT
jgi:hypothetical protein